MKVGSLFAGIGGFDLAAEQTGHKVAWQVENDKAASKVLAHHWPEVTNFGDITQLTDLPAVDVLTGGFPCQDYSVAGQRSGLAGDRGALWWDYRRIIAHLRPTWVVGENVPGLLSSRGGADLETIIGSLTELGYGVAWAVLDAQYFGVAQRRRRLFIVGHSGGVPRPEVLALQEGLYGHPEPSRPERSDVAGPIAPSSGSGGFRNDLDTSGAYITGTPIGVGGGDLSPALVTPTGGLAAKQNQYAFVIAPALTSGQGVGKLDDQAVGQLIVNGRQDPITSEIAQPLDINRGSQALMAFAQNQRDELRDLDDQAGALAAEPGMKQQTFIAGSGVRRLTPLECERLQGFPDGWTDTPGNSDNQRYRQLGNAVAVPVARWIMERIGGTR